MLRLLEADFAQIYALSPESLAELSEKRLLLTGGTGFFGKWVLGFLKYANSRGLNLEVFVLSRDPARFLKANPDFQSPHFHFVAGDVRTFEFSKPVDFVLHAATEANDALNNEKPFEMFDVTVEGTKRVLDVIRPLAPKKTLLISSGAVYGTQAIDVPNQPDESKSAPDVHSCRSAYAEGKRVSELLGVLHASISGQSVNFARCFAFVGPYLPLDTHFAIGNFIRDCRDGRTIQIKGDGSARRSYMYASDLVVWLLQILTRGQSGRSYNVGSEESISIGDLAKTVADVWSEFSSLPAPAVEILGKPGREIHRYVPSCGRARSELGLNIHVSLRAGIRKTFEHLAYL